MKSIKINIVLPKASELKGDLNTLVKQIQDQTKLKLDLDISNFQNSIGEVSQALAKLKFQISSMGSVEELIKTSAVAKSNDELERQNKILKEHQSLIGKEGTISTSTTVKLNDDGTEKVIKDMEKARDEIGQIITTITNYGKDGAIESVFETTTNDIEKLAIASKKAEESVEKVQYALTNKLNSSMSNQNFTLIDDSVFTNLQQRINSVNTDTPTSEIRELQTAIGNLGNSDGQIVRLQNAITKYEIKLKGLKERYEDLVPDEEVNEAISKIEQLKNTLSSIQSGESFTNKSISNFINETSSSMNKVTTATKNASEQQRLYNKEVVTFGSAFKDVATKVGVFNLVNSAINLSQRAIRNGVDSIVDMDTALANLNKVVDLSNSQLLEMRDNAVSMGEALGRSSIEVANAQAEFGRQYKDMETINKMTETAIMGANVMDGVSAGEVAKGLTTIIASMNLESADAITIIDSLNEVQNNYRVESNQMLNALSKVGSTAKIAGASLFELEGYITALTVSTGKSGDEVGESLKSLTARLYKIGTEGLNVSPLVV